VALVLPTCQPNSTQALEGTQILVKDERGIFEYVSRGIDLGFAPVVRAEGILVLDFLQLGIPYLDVEQRNYRTYSEILPRKFFF
jgi:hypothetical protein